MQNFALLTAVGQTNHPVVLKSGFSATVNEWLTAADYLLAGGNRNVILCERGIRTFEDSVHFSLDISAIPVIKKFSYLPIIVDPSHAAGHYSLLRLSPRQRSLPASADCLLKSTPIPKKP